MEYLAPNFAEGENNIKMLVPYEISSTLLSIEVYVNYDRAGYNLIKTITSADY
jgi:hypothetical protein